MHLKRQKAPKKWPISRKENVFIVRPNSNIKNGIPVLVVLRDILKITQTRKEVKKAIHQKNILLNQKPLKDEKESATLFDIITIVPSKKNYRIDLSENRKFKVEEVNKNDSEVKVSKIIGKKTLKGKKTQLNLMDGRNILSEMKCKVNDSVIIKFNDKKIDKCLPLKEKSKVIIFDGKHMGKRGTIEKIIEERKMASVKCVTEKLNILIKQLMVLE